MEKRSSIINGGIKLPIGYRFHPTDEELLVHYLKRKALALPLPASVIPDFDVFQTDPWGLPGDLKEKRYFFRTRKRSNSKCKRAAGSGYWKVIGKEKQILASESNQAVLGIRRSLVFCERKCSNGSKTRWVMHEYCLPYSTQVSENLEMEDWVVYSVFQRKTSTPAKQRFISQRSSTKKTRRLEDSSDLGGPPQPSSSCSSEITEVSSNGFLDQEETSPHLWFSSFSS
ncbi:hypothetical protein SLA2020_303540 [Shorea laevis]